ncbi:MAG: metalloregulator ArsR/SmtB family transcription factor [Pseudomonadota bacterium]
MLAAAEKFERRRDENRGAKVRLDANAQEQEQQQDLREESAAAFLKAAADPLRLRVLRLLRQDAMGVSELCDLLAVRQPALSHHLKVLSGAGLLRSERDGNHIFYRRSDVDRSLALATLQQAVLATADQLELDQETLARLNILQKTRELNSRNFFKQNVQKFREQQDLIAAPVRYAEAVEELVTSLSATGSGTALELGPGEGWLLPILGLHFETVHAVDNAEVMLDAAQRTVDQTGLKNIKFHLGDSSGAFIDEIDADLVVLNMVLHHTAEPKRTLSEAVRCVKPGGALLITELCEHKQGWARESCGDLWLGFAPTLLEEWAGSAGMLEQSSSYLGQRNGFTLQVRLFQRAPLS